jgi:hypothetical protein
MLAGLELVVNQAIELDSMDSRGRLPHMMIALYGAIEASAWA